MMKETACETVYYKEVDGKKLRMLIVKPDDWKVDDNRTAIVWIHGGGFKSGNFSRPEIYLPQSHYFANRGVVSFDIQYRLITEPGVTTNNCVQDAKSAMRYIRMHSKEYGISPNKIVVVGESAGGYLATSLVTLSEINDPADDLSISAVPDAVVNCNGVVDFVKWNVKGAASEEEIEKWRKLSPTHNIKSGLPPLLNLQGESDKTIKPEITIKFHQDYLVAGNKSEIVLWPDAKHGFLIIGYTATEEQNVRAVNAIDSFLCSLQLIFGAPNLEI